MDAPLREESRPRWTISRFVWEYGARSLIDGAR